MEQSNVFDFDGFQIERESYLGGDCYGVVTSCKKDGAGIPYHLEVEFDISKARFSFSKCYAHEVVPCDELSAGGKLKIMVYLLEKVACAYVTEKADGLTIEESFYLYILAQNWANGDEFSWNCGGLEEESVSLVEEARKMKL